MYNYFSVSKLVVSPRSGGFTMHPPSLRFSQSPNRDPNTVLFTIQYFKGYVTGCTLQVFRWFSPRKTENTKAFLSWFRSVYFCDSSACPQRFFFWHITVKKWRLTADDKNIARKSHLFCGGLSRRVFFIDDKNSGPLVCRGPCATLIRLYATQHRIDSSRRVARHLSYSLPLVQLHKEIQQTVFRFFPHYFPISFDPTFTKNNFSVCLIYLSLLKLGKKE